MNDDRLLQEMVARCVSIMVAYYNSGPKERATREMITEVEAAAKEVKTLSLGITDIVKRILHPVEGELYARYGHELGSRMNSQFLMAFEGFGAHGRIVPKAS